MPNSLFFLDIYTLCKQIPPGKVATYSQLANLAGKPKAARAVGMAMKKNPDAPATPCHRVVGSDGSLTGYSAGLGCATKKHLLIKEGVIFKKDRVDLSISQWRV